MRIFSINTSSRKRSSHSMTTQSPTVIQPEDVTSRAIVTLLSVRRRAFPFPQGDAGGQVPEDAGQPPQLAGDAVLVEALPGRHGQCRQQGLDLGEGLPA